MNKVILMGRLTKDPLVSHTQTQAGDLTIARYSLAVDRKKTKNQNPNAQTADFINCSALGKNGEFAEKYLKKGTKIAITGHIQTSSYTNKEGQKVYTTEVVVDDHEFAESKGNSDTTAAPNKQASPPFMDGIRADDDEELPWV